MTTDTDDLRALPDPDEFLPDGVYGNREVRFAMCAYAQAARAPLLAEIERLKTPLRIDLEGLAQRTMERLETAERERDELRARLEAIDTAPTILRTVDGQIVESYRPSMGTVELIERPRRLDPLEGKLGFWPIERLK